MQFFDRPSGRSKIALRGSSSRPKTSEELLANAKKAREERAHLRQQHQAARTLQRLYRAHNAAKHAATSLSSVPAATPNVELLRFVLLSGIVNAETTSVSRSIEIVRRAVYSRPFVTVLAERLCKALPSAQSTSKLTIASQYPAASELLTVKAAVLLCCVAANSLEGPMLNNDLAAMASKTLRVLCDSLTVASVAHQAQWALAVHISHLLRITLSRDNPPAVIIRTISHIVLQMLECTQRTNAINSEQAGLLNTQIAISLLSVDRGFERVIGAVGGKRRREIISIFIRTLARPYPLLDNPSPSEIGNGVINAFQWDFVHSLTDQSVQNVAILLSSTLNLADYTWADKDRATRWPFIAVISSLIHALPKDVLHWTGSDDSDDDDSGTDVMMLDVSSVGQASAVVADGLSSPQAFVQESNGKRISSSVLRAVMTRVSTALDRMVSEESVRNIFAAAISEGHFAVLRVCELFNFLTRRERKLIVPLRDALALWRGPSTSACHILTSLWRHCISDSEDKSVSSNGGDVETAPSTTSSAGSRTGSAKTTTKVLRPEAGPILSVFAGTYAYLLYIQDVDEMFHSEWPFSLEEVREVAIILKAQLFNALFVRNPRLSKTPMSIESKSGPNFLRSEDGLLDDVTRLLSRLHAVDSQRRFTFGDSFWEAGHGALSSDSFLNDAIEAGPQVLTRGREEASVGAVRQVTYGNSRQSGVSGAGELIRVAPYLVPFATRSKVFQSWIEQERDEANYGPVIGSERTVSVRRQSIFEDAFRELNGLGAGLRSTVRIKFIDEHGLEEAGIDGGGVFKEFMHEVLRLGFSPYSYGLFKETPEEGHLYPNPDAHIASENFRIQFEFLGRLLGKAVFDGLLVDIPLAKFFRLKLLGEISYPTDLMSLDPELYKNVKYLKSCPPKMVEELGLNFTVANNAFGATNEVELKRNGRNVMVTANNRIEYIHRLAHYRMNSQIKEQSEAFLKGFYEVVPSQFIRLFSHEELQLLISGKGGKIDLVDWRRNTRYSGGFNEDTPVIRWFWTAVSELEADEQAKMLQFVTSCPRAPLLGFAYLIPGFCIHRAEGSDRLPTASTCMNLLKLPEYRSLSVVRQKLKYALQSNAGFDLS